MLKQLVQSNNQLRGSMEEVNKELTKYKAEAYELNLENQNFREKLSLYETGELSPGTNKSDSSDPSTMQKLLQLQKYCKQLEMQLKYTEFEKLKMTTEMTYMGNKEPTHPIFLEPMFPSLVDSGKKSMMGERSLKFKTRSKSRPHLPSARSKHKIDKGNFQSLLNSEDTDK